jgi:hypothetical protein
LASPLPASDTERPVSRATNERCRSTARAVTTLG